jgi:hypothetical protein
MVNLESLLEELSDKLMQMWDALLSVVDKLVLNEEPDTLIWCYNNSGVYYSQSFYAIINCRGIIPSYIPVVWNIVVPPKVQLFL